jgi:hypothetical protein
MNPETHQTNFSGETKKILENRIWISITEGDHKISGLEYADPKTIRTMIHEAIEQITTLEKATVPAPGERLERLHSDTDVVMVLSGPGKYSQTIEPGIEKPVDTQYHSILWTRKLDRARIRAGVVAMIGVVAKRAGKEMSDVTSEDIMQFGPYLHYAATMWENSHFDKVLSHFAELGLHIPKEKLITYSHVQNNIGEEREIKNTYDQFSGLQIPEDTRRLLVVAHAPHLLRGMYILNHYPKVIHEAKVQLYPLRSPESSLATKVSFNGEMTSMAEYVHMEIRGIIANYANRKGSREPYPFEI